MSASPHMDHDDLTIRPARPTEAAELSALAFRSKAFWGYSDAFMEACRRELTYSAQQIRSEEYHFAVADVGGSCVGFYALERHSFAKVELEALFVDPDSIGRGYGRRLMDDAKRNALRMGATSLTLQGDPHAEAFYRAAGGVRSGERESASIPGRYLPTFTIDLRDAP